MTEPAGEENVDFGSEKEDMPSVDQGPKLQRKPSIMSPQKGLNASFDEPENNPILSR